MPTFEQSNILLSQELVNSVPSATIPLADIPEPAGYKVKFEFEGFEISETIQTRLNGFQSVIIQFETIPESPGFVVNTIRSSTNTDSLISYNNTGKIQSELLSAMNVSSIFLQDNFASDSASDIIEQIALGLNVDIKNLSLSDGASAISTAVRDITTSEPTTPGVDVAIGAAIDNNISDNIVQALLAEYSFRNETGVSVSDIDVSFIGKLVEKSHAVFIDNRIINDVSYIVGKNPFGTFSPALASDAINGEYNDLQSLARNNFVPNNINSEDYEFVVNPILTTPEDSSEISEVKIAGYMIEKFEIIDGALLPHVPFVISANQALPGQVFKLIDPDVTLGGIYTYILSSLALFKIRNVNNLESGDLEDIEIIVKSRPQTTTIVAGVEFPNSPTDINYYYDQERGDLMLVWDFPNNDQTSLIKKFQIFRRESLSEPFTLIRQYDFDDSLEPVEQIDDVDFGLNVKLKEPLTFYIDEDFKKDKEYIYALCSISAEGASSQYSTQTSVRFSTAKNDLVMKKVSQSGAPKPYPNFYVEQDLDVDIMRVSKANAMTIFFDPDVFNLNIPGDTNADGIIDPDEITPTQFMVTDRIGGKYVMQLINTDLLKEQRFEITLEDKSSLVTNLAGS